MEFGYALISCSVNGLTFAVASLEKIEALIRVGDSDRAVEIASMALTGEERLQLLAKAANAMKARDLVISAEIRENIELLRKSVDVSTLGTLGVDIACDLVSVDIKSAYEIFNAVVNRSHEISSEERRGGFRVSNLNENAEADLRHESVKKIPVHYLSKFSSAAIKRIQTFKFAVIQKRAKDEEPTFGLVLLKMWMRANAHSTELFDAANSALDLILLDTTSAPQIEDIREIAGALRNIKQWSDVRSLVDRIEGQYISLGSRVVSIESVRLKMHILLALHAEEQNLTELRLIDLFIEIESIVDISTRASCWAWMLNDLSRFPKKNELEANTSLIAEVLAKLDATIDSLLSMAADHFVAARGAIEALAKHDGPREPGPSSFSVESNNHNG